MAEEGYHYAFQCSCELCDGTAFIKANKWGGSVNRCPNGKWYCLVCEQEGGSKDGWPFLSSTNVRHHILDEHPEIQ